MYNTKRNLLSASFLASLALADIRIDPNQTPDGVNQVACGMVWRIPSTFGYQGIINQKKENNDQFLRSNIDNEANQRNAATEPAQDMLPFRQRAKGEIRVIPVGQPQDLPLRWNNPHDSDCEVNIFIDDQTNVVPIKRPFPSGGGYGDHLHSFTIPSDFPYCRSAQDNCVIQVYCHSVEPRTYAIGIDFVAVDYDNSTAVESFRKGDKMDIPVSKVQPAMHYWDSFDTSHVDSAYSGYRGQQGAFIREEVRAAITLQSYVGNGGLVPLGNIDTAANAALRKEIQNEIKTAEAAAEKRNKAAQAALPPGVCFEGEMYGVVNNPKCDREYTNTYVTNVGYAQILKNFMSVFKAKNAYEPMRKCTPGETPVDPYGQFKNGKEPSMVPTGQNAFGTSTPRQPPAAGTHIRQMYGGCTNTPALPLDPRLSPADYTTGPQAQGGPGNQLAFATIGTNRKGTCPALQIPPNGPKTNPNKPKPVTTTTTTYVVTTSSTAVVTSVKPGTTSVKPGTTNYPVSTTTTSNVVSPTGIVSSTVNYGVVSSSLQPTTVPTSVKPIVTTSLPTYVPTTYVAPVVSSSAVYPVVSSSAVYQAPDAAPSQEAVAPVVSTQETRDAVDAGSAAVLPVYSSALNHHRHHLTSALLLLALGCLFF